MILCSIQTVTVTVIRLLALITLKTNVQIIRSYQTEQVRYVKRICCYNSALLHYPKNHMGWYRCIYAILGICKWGMIKSGENFGCKKGLPYFQFRTLIVRLQVALIVHFSIHANLFYNHIHIVTFHSHISWTYKTSVLQFEGTTMRNSC